MWNIPFFYKKSIARAQSIFYFYDVEALKKDGINENLVNSSKISWLDRFGSTVAEGLLTQKVLQGARTPKGWKNHPQRIRFKEHNKPLESIGFYLNGIYKESINRGYKYNFNKIIKTVENLEEIKITNWQIEYEFNLLQERLEKRKLNKYREREPKSKEDHTPSIIHKSRWITWVLGKSILEK